MRVDKIILRAALTTLAAIALLFAVMLAALCFAFPSTMMEITYNLGMDAQSVRYATSAYNRTDNVYYIAYATEVAIGAEDDKEIISSGKRLIADEAFASYCATQADGYEQFVCGKVALALYKTGKQDEAIMLASGCVGEDKGFAKANAYAVLMMFAKSKADTATVDKMKGKIEEIAKQALTDENFLSDEEQAYLDGLCGALGLEFNG